jgi:flagellar assembly factor FliW
MSDEIAQQGPMMTLKSSRFGELEVPVASVIEIPQGFIGFPKANRFVMLEHKPPFSWLHSIEDPGLAFVVVDGFEFGGSYDVKPPYSDRDCDFKEGDEYAILVIVTVRPDPKATTANLKAPIFVNLKNRKGVQTIFDDSRFSTRFPLWANPDEEESK